MSSASFSPVTSVEVTRKPSGVPVKTWSLNFETGAGGTGAGATAGAAGAAVSSGGGGDSTASGATGGGCASPPQAAAKPTKNARDQRARSALMAAHPAAAAAEKEPAKRAWQIGALLASRSFLRELFLVRLDHLLLLLLRNRGVAREFHREVALALRRRTKVSRVTEHRVQRNVRDDRY